MIFCVALKFPMNKLLPSLARIFSLFFSFSLQLFSLFFIFSKTKHAFLFFDCVAYLKGILTIPHLIFFSFSAEFIHLVSTQFVSGNIHSIAWIRKIMLKLSQQPIFYVYIMTKGNAYRLYYTIHESKYTHKKLKRMTA